MVVVDVRKQGGAAIVTIPSAILKLLGLEVGSKLELDVRDRVLIAREHVLTERKRMTLSQLLEGAATKKVGELNRHTAWSRIGISKGQERS